MIGDTTEPKQDTSEKVPDKKEVELSEEVKSLIEKTAQAEADRVRTKYSQTIKEKEAEIERLKLEKMGEKEARKFLEDKAKEELAAKEKEITQRELKLTAYEELKKHELDLSFTEYVIGQNKEDTIKRVELLKKSFGEALSKAIDTQMKGAGREPNKGRATGGTSDGFEGMTAKEIQDRARKDKDWWSKNEKAILDATAKGLIKRS